MNINLIFDIKKRRILPKRRRLTQKQFNLMLFLAIRRTDGSPGWVTCAEIARRVPHWNQKVESVGKEISRYSGEYSWFDLVEYDKISRGPYRLRHNSPTFKPNRDIAYELIINPRPTRKASIRRSRSRYLDPTELQAYDLIVQYGFYITAVTDLIMQRIGNPERIRNLDDRLIAYRILVTFKKNRGKIKESRELAFKGLKIAERIKYKDDFAYLLDQIGGTYYIEKDFDEAQNFFRKEIEFLNDWGTHRAEFHLVGAYRGLAATLRSVGDLFQAKKAIEKSKYYAKRSGNEEGLRIAGLEEFRINSEKSVEEVTDLIASQPTQHVTARVMALSIAAEKLLSSKLFEEGRLLLERAFAEATRFHFQNQIENICTIAKNYKIELNCK